MEIKGIGDRIHAAREFKGLSKLPFIIFRRPGPRVPENQRFPAKAEVICLTA